LLRLSRCTNSRSVASSAGVAALGEEGPYDASRRDDRLSGKAGVGSAALLAVRDNQGMDVGEVLVSLDYGDGVAAR
jgi:hypothetical protein